MKEEQVNYFKLIRDRLNKKVTIMIIPTAEGEIKQVRLLKSLMVAAVFLMVSIGLFLTTSSVLLLRNNQTLANENTDYSDAIVYKDDAIAALSGITSQQETEISQLSHQVTVSADYFNNKLKEIAVLEGELNQLIGMFNQRTDLEVKTPVSRSGNFSNDVTQEVSVLDDLSNWEGEDVLSDQIAEQISAYSALAGELENTLDFLDAKPTLMPVNGIITSKFGNRRDPITRRIAFHKGIDIANSTGTSIHAAGSGVVTFAGWSGTYGRVIVISHGYGYESVYAHNSKISVKVGDQVTKGDVIGKVGSSGKSTGPHTHFEVHFEGVQIDPLTVLNK
ncbi:M23 family peptidase [Fusibacter sp. A1]|nr:M23 family peptidase [Fusibacter sp. A1]